ncbi:MAG TPA: AsmA-like C-terminal domain-containing protein [Stellaceae bacterium]|nr:AsmA-like C-terminal domain-containing protein [Stellaceae bacterium]
MRRSLAIFIRVLAAMVAGLAVVAGFAIWVLWNGPISLDSIAPYIAAALSRGNGITATIDHTLLSINSDGHVGILARGVHLSRSDSGDTLTLDQMNIEFSVEAALGGVIAPTQITVTRPALHLVRETDGSFHLGLSGTGAPAAGDWEFIGDLVRPAGGGGTLGYLTKVDIDAASLTVDDRSLGLTWRADNVDLSLARGDNATSGNFSVVSGAARFSGNYIYTVADNNLVVRLDFADLKPALWADAAPSLAGLAALDVPFSGEVVAVIDGAHLAPRDATWDVSLGAGTIKDSAFAGGALAIAGARIQGGYDPAHRRLNIGLLTVELSHGAVGISGAVDGIGPELLLSGNTPSALGLRLTLAAEALKVDDFQSLWPEYAAVDTRNWVTQHLSAGTIDRLQAQLNVDLDFSPNAPKRAIVHQFDGSMSFSGLSVEYFRPLPPARNVSGDARFDHTQITFTASDGEVGNIKATDATAQLYQLDTHDEQAKIDVDAAGPLADALALLDTPPLYYARGMGIDPSRAAGRFSARLDVAFPLQRDLPLDLVDYSANASLSGVGIGNVVLDRDLSDGDLALKLDRKSAQATGSAKLAGVPVQLTWNESLLPKATVRTRYDVTARLDDAQRRALGFDMLDDYVSGPIGVTASYSLGAKRNGQASATLDLSDSTLTIPMLDWRKPSGVAATGKATIDFVGGQVIDLRNATLVGGGINGALSIDFGANGLSSVVVEHVVAGDSDLHGSLTIGGDGRWTFVAAGKSLDAAGLLKQLDERPAQVQEPPLTIEANLDRLILGPGRQASGVTASLVSDGPHWTEAAITLGLGQNANLQVNFGGALGERQFKLSTDDFGTLLRFSDVYDNVQGGTFSLTGTAEDRKGQRVLVANADGGDYRVVGAQALARLLSVASLSGIGALLSGQGIPFSRIAGQVIFTGDIISLEGMRAYGGALGINASGNVDRATGQMNIEGTLVPAYTLNSVLGNIPLLGNLLVGGAGQGIFAANFRIYGDRANPKVSVNPLSTLAPGVLRNLFLFAPPGGP